MVLRVQLQLTYESSMQLTLHCNEYTLTQKRAKKKNQFTGAAQHSEIFTVLLRARRTRTMAHATRIARSLRVFSRLRSEEHTSELQSRENLVCRLLLEKK